MWLLHFRKAMVSPNRWLMISLWRFVALSVAGNVIEGKCRGKSLFLSYFQSRTTHIETCLWPPINDPRKTKLSYLIIISPHKSFTFLYRFLSNTTLRSFTCAFFNDDGSHVAVGTRIVPYSFFVQYWFPSSVPCVPCLIWCTTTGYEPKCMHGIVYRDFPTVYHLFTLFRILSTFRTYN